MRIRPCSTGAVIACAILMVILSATSSWVETFRGSTRGTVTQWSGAAVSNATVTIHNVATAIDRITQTNVDGSYLVPELQIGTYTVTVELNGFQKSVTTGVTVDVASEKRIDAVLKPGAVTNIVTVAGEELAQIHNTGDTRRGVLTQ